MKRKKTNEPPGYSGWWDRTNLDWWFALVAIIVSIIGCFVWSLK